MADLLSSRDKADIAAAMLDIKDTFFVREITLQVKQEKVVEFKASNEDTYEKVSYTLGALFSPSKEKSDISQQGTADTNDSFILVYVPQLLAFGLMDSFRKTVIKPGRDSFVFDSEEYDILSVEALPTLAGVMTFVKIMFRKRLS